MSTPWAMIVVFLSLLTTGAACRATSGSSPAIAWTGDDVEPLDTHRELYELKGVSQAQRDNTNSVVMLVKADSLQKQPNGWKLATTLFIHENESKTKRGPLCPDEPFSQQPSAGFCSGVLVRGDVVATAYHCYRDAGESLDGFAFVFGFAMKSKDEVDVDLGDSQVYHAKERIAWDPAAGDWALFQLDRPTGKPPARMRTSGAARTGDPLYAIGHPIGLPLKFTDQGQVVGDPKRFLTNLDTYTGSSGSPVFGPSDELEGLVLRGGTDFEWDHSYSCYRPKQCPPLACQSEEVTPVANFVKSLP